MREITASATVYTFDELSDAAKQRAVQEIQEMLGRARDSDDIEGALLERLEQAVRETLREAWQAGRKELDYRESEEYAKEWIEGNDVEFHQDGTQYTGTLKVGS